MRKSRQRIAEELRFERFVRNAAAVAGCLVLLLLVSASLSGWKLAFAVAALAFIIVRRVIAILKLKQE